MKKVLIVEDSAATRSLIKAVIDDLGGDVESIEAKTGFEALKALPAGPFDLILTDINMPDINGLELINFVRSSDAYRRTPLVIVTTERGAEDRRRGLALGADDYVTKPFRPEQLQEAIRRFLH